MALCVVVTNSGGINLSTTQTIDTCTTYVLGTAQDYASLPTLTDIFTMPLAGDLSQMWMLGFSMPIITYLTAWGYGVVINWFSDKKRY